MNQQKNAGQAVQEFLQELEGAAQISSLAEAIALRNSAFIEAEAAFAELFARFAPEEGPCQIEADEVIIELVDRSTGQLYRRPIELNYKENENGIVLTGEDMAGQPSSIVYLSGAYMQRLADISGQGPEEGHCH